MENRERCGFAFKCDGTRIDVRPKFLSFGCSELNQNALRMADSSQLFHHCRALVRINVEVRRMQPHGFGLRNSKTIRRPLIDCENAAVSDCRDHGWKGTDVEKMPEPRLAVAKELFGGFGRFRGLFQPSMKAADYR